MVTPLLILGVLLIIQAAVGTIWFAMAVLFITSWLQKTPEDKA